MIIFPVISYVDLIVVLVVAWILASFPIYVAGKIISGKDTSFGSAMIAALIGPACLSLLSSCSHSKLYQNHKELADYECPWYYFQSYLMLIS